MTNEQALFDDAVNNDSGDASWVAPRTHFICRSTSNSTCADEGDDARFWCPMCRANYLAARVRELEADSDEDTAIVLRAKALCNRFGLVVDADNEGYTTRCLRRLKELEAENARLMAARDAVETFRTNALVLYRTNALVLERAAHAETRRERDVAVECYDAARADVSDLRRQRDALAQRWERLKAKVSEFVEYRSEDAACILQDMAALESDEGAEK